MPSPTRNASYYLAGATLSYIGTAIVPVAISFAVLDSGHGAGALGLVLAAQTVPTLALLLFAGVAADRRSRRGIMIRADLFRALAQAVLAAFLILGHAPLVLMVAVAALIGVGNAFFQPASGGFLTEIVSRERLGRTNGLLRMANALAMVIGPALGGAVVATTGPGWGIALDAASYLASATCLLAIGSAAASAMPGTRPIGHDLSEAWRDMRATRWMVPIVCQ
jgi:MFS family permease